MITKGRKKINPQRITEQYTARQETRLLDVLSSLSGRSRTATKKLIAAAKVLVNDSYKTQANAMVKEGDKISVSSLSAPKPFRHPLLRIIYQDEYILIAEKDAGLLSVRTNTNTKAPTAIKLLSGYLKERDSLAKLFMVTRLDKDTSGFIIFAKSIEAKTLLVEQFSKLLREQEYIAVCSGVPPKEEMQINSTSNLPRQKNKTTTAAVAHKSETVLKLIKSDGEKTVVSLNVLKGRIYSLRRLMYEQNLRIVGDKRYKPTDESNNFPTEKLCLEQHKLSLLHPFTGEVLSFTRPFPTHLFSYLRKSKEREQQSQR